MAEVIKFNVPIKHSEGYKLDSCFVEERLSRVGVCVNYMKYVMSCNNSGTLQVSFFTLDVLKQYGSFISSPIFANNKYILYVTNLLADSS